MNIYIDESGSINNHMPNNKYFVIALIYITNKKGLDRAYKRFVSENHTRLKELDAGKSASNGSVLKSANKMFVNGRFCELKGSQFDKEMKKKFLQFFSQKKHFEVYYIILKNHYLEDKFCQNTSRAFNYALRLALEYFIKRKKWLPDENCHLQIDERNEKTETKHFLESYLNTELTLSGAVSADFTVTYFDSCNNKGIQIADVFANAMWSELKTNAYTEDLNQLRRAGIIRGQYYFPYYTN